MPARAELAPKTRSRLLAIAETIANGETLPAQYLGDNIPTHLINVLPQTRRTFEDVDVLAEDLARHRLLHPLIVARLSKEDTEKHLALINALWKTDFKASNLMGVTEDNQLVFYILLAGERRYRACRHLQEVGCTTCQERYGAGGCYQRHFPEQAMNGESKIEVRLCRGIGPIRAIFIQLSENTHMRVPPHEEARVYYELFKLIREVEPKFPIARFASEVGRRPDYVRSAIKFCELPNSVREFVEKGSIAYGMALEIARLQDLGLSESELQWWAQRAEVGSYKVPEFRQQVTTFISDRTSGQTMLGIFTEAAEMEMRRAFIRQTVAREVIVALWSYIHYLQRVNGMIADGRIAKKESPYSHRSPVKVWREMLDVIAKTLPQWREILPKNVVADAKKILEETEQSSPDPETLPEEPVGLLTH